MTNTEVSEASQTPAVQSVLVINDATRPLPTTVTSKTRGFQTTLFLDYDSQYGGEFHGYPDRPSTFQLPTTKRIVIERASAVCQGTVGSRPSMSVEVAPAGAR